MDKGARVAVLRTITGDDGGEVEFSSEFIREQDLKGITRVKWFLHSIEHLDMVGRGSGGVSKSQHMLGDKVMCALLFNAAKRDSRERLYTMSETGYSTLMALAAPVLESSVSASAAVPSLPCVKCQSVFSMFIKSQPDPEQVQVDDEEGFSLAIPDCEMLDLLRAIAETDNSKVHAHVRVVCHSCK